MPRRAAPVQRNRREEAEIVKDGIMPLGWKDACQSGEALNTCAVQRPSVKSRLAES
ncbi:hypothetical protein [Janthinobacterium sp. MDT1-19]|uniref:hypothetical protein n=1 Tax=Janthinobacterium sp. MDT1-19 TaxID=1259339 RepID=UPI003F20CC02